MHPWDYTIFALYMVGILGIGGVFESGLSTVVFGLLASGVVFVVASCGACKPTPTSGSTLEKTS